MSDLKSFTKFVPLVKVEEKPDGTMKVYGLVTAEEPDRDNEVCHYTSTVPFYRAMAEEFKKATSIPGVDPSIAPLRYMHGPDAVGKGTQMDFDDANKSIMMGFDVIDKAAIEKVRKGVLTGFSQGGQYAKTWRANGKDGKEYLFYTAKVGEISLVDSPCLETARFEYVKADGSKELRKFSRDEPAQAAEPAGPGLVLSTSDVLRVAAATAAIIKADKEKDDDEDEDDANKTSGAPSGEPNGSAAHKPTQGPPVPASQVSDMGVGEAKLVPVEPLLFADKFRAAAAKAGIAKGTEADKIKAAYYFMASKSIPVIIRESVFKTIFKPDGTEAKVNAQTYALDLVRACNSEAPEAIAKSLWDVKDLVDVIHTLSFVQRCLHDEAVYENDNSQIPSDLVQLLERLCEIFVALVGEETAELLAAISGQKGAVKATMNDLEKAKSLAQHLKAGHAMVSDHHESTMGMHKAHHDHMHVHIEKVMKALKALMDGGLVKGAELEKAKDAHEHLGVMKTMVTGHMNKAMGKSASFHTKMRGHLNKMAKAIGAEEESVEGEGPDDASVIEPGSEGPYPGTAHPHEGKFVTADDIIKILDAREAARDAKETESITKFIEALNKNSGGSGVPGSAAGPQYVETGIGDRTLVVKTANTPYQTHIVGKDQDTAGTGNLGKGPDVSEELKKVDVTKALVQGDASEMLKIARTITPAAGGIPQHLSGIKALSR